MFHLGKGDWAQGYVQNNLKIFVKFYIFFKFNFFDNFLSIITRDIPAGNYLFKVNNKNTRKRCEICSKLTIKIPERLH